MDGARWLHNDECTYSYKWLQWQILLCLFSAYKPLERYLVHGEQEHLEAVTALLLCYIIAIDHLTLIGRLELLVTGLGLSSVTK